MCDKNCSKELPSDEWCESCQEAYVIEHLRVVREEIQDRKDKEAGIYA